LFHAFICVTTPHFNIEGFVRLGLIPHFDWAQGQIILGVDREMTAKVGKVGDIQPDTPAPLGPDARKQIKLPGTRSLERK
jgi:hypothetical protein